MSEQKNKKMFKTTFGGGYQKNDVNAYIEYMQAQFQSIEQTLKNTINHQRAELDQLRGLSAEAEDAKAAAEQLQAALDGTAEKLGQVSAELEHCKVTCISAEAARATAEASLAAVTAAAEEAAGTAKEELAKRTAERDAAKQALELLRVQYEQLKSEKQVLQETVDAAAEEEALAAACETMSDAAATANPEESVLPAEYEALKLKAEQYDRMSAHIGTIMLKANADAEDVVRGAREQADAMLDEVNRTLEETRARTQASADRLIGDIGTSLAEISRGCKEEIAADLEELRTALRTLEVTVESKYTDINRKLDYTKEEMEQAAGAIIRSATAPVTLDSSK